MVLALAASSLIHIVLNFHSSTLYILDILLLVLTSLRKSPGRVKREDLCVK